MDKKAQKRIELLRKKINDTQQRLAGARKQIQKTPELYISAITGFEVALKHRSGKLGLPAEPGEWLAVVLAHHSIEVVPLDLSICTTAVRLPSIHRDPCDRFIIATARLNQWPVVTGDRHFTHYGIEVIS